MDKRAILTPEELQAYLTESTISLAQTYIKAPEVLKVGDSVLGTLGNFSVSIGKAKSKKTFNVSAMIAASLSNGSVLHYRAEFPADKRFILYFDTEQGQIHCQKVLKRITKLLYLPGDADPENLLMVALRKYDPNTRVAIIEALVDKDDKSISVVESVLSRDKDFEPFAFCINEDILPELVEDYSPTEKGPGRPKKPAFDPHFDITESVHRCSLEVSFKDGNIGSYEDFLAKLQEGYQSQGVKLNYNKAVALAKYLRNKRMVVKEGKLYIYKPDFVY